MSRDSNVSDCLCRAVVIIWVVFELSKRPGDLDRVRAEISHAIDEDGEKREEKPWSSWSTFGRSRFSPSWDLIVTTCLHVPMTQLQHLLPVVAPSFQPSCSTLSNTGFHSKPLRDSSVSNFTRTCHLPEVLFPSPLFDDIYEDWEDERKDP